MAENSKRFAEKTFMFMPLRFLKIPKIGIDNFIVDKDDVNLRRDFLRSGGGMYWLYSTITIKYLEIFVQIVIPSMTSLMLSFYF